MEEHYLLVFSLACWTCFLIQPRTIFPGVAPLTVLGWALSYQSSIQKMTYHRVSHRHSDRGIFSINVPSSEITLAYVMLEKKKQSMFTRTFSIMFYSNDTEPIVQNTPVIPALGRGGRRTVSLRLSWATWWDCVQDKSRSNNS